DEVPYEEWFENIKYFLKKYGVKGKRVLDLGCGTGTMSILLKKGGFDVSGIDISEDMLAVAAEKAEEENTDIFFSCQDMRSFEVLKPFDAVISLCDCMNYVTEGEDLKKALKSCRKALNDGGILIFDINSAYKLKEVLGCDSFCEANEDSAFTCENYFDEETGINEYYVNIFTEDENGKYDRFEELHREKAYSEEEIETLLKEAGFELLEKADAESLEKPYEKSERIYFICRKQRKEN
ncbi:MAG: class I SAM-dependent methyltransferase, partial [Clostridiales bacterium]|nr:class I SAM-dependent methyltransferase [Clostridiales bacterium]